MKKKSWFKRVLLRRVLIIVSLVLQAATIVDFLLDFSKYSKWMSVTLNVASFLVVLYIVSRKDKGAFKTSWMALVLLFPVFGGVLYLLFNFQRPTRKFAQRIHQAENETKPLNGLPGDSCREAVETLPRYTSNVRYLQECAGYPIYSGTDTEFYCPGEEFFAALLPELEKAEKYIFLEYFIVEEGIMWNSILDILKRKAEQGVKVRVIYDDVGCFLTLPQNYAAQLRDMGIECELFNPFRPVLTVKQNNRDHRKIASIDGKVAFTGGINLADEYINAVEKFGHWRDSAIKVEGKAAWSFTLMFLQTWQVCTNQTEDYESYYPWREEPCLVPDDGFVQPYADAPVDSEHVGEHVYMHIITGARDYLYINTPYLIVDDSMVSALCLAAKSGVDVRIITPHHWDKWVIHVTTRSYYRELIREGVKIYEYTDGFNHSKTFVSDDQVATVGTINVDFRSMYHHFECGTLLLQSKAVDQVKQDFLDTLPACQEITEKDCKYNVFMRAFQDILRLFAPLM